MCGIIATELCARVSECLCVHGPSWAKLLRKRGLTRAHSGLRLIVFVLQTQVKGVQAHAKTRRQSSRDASPGPCRT